MKEIICLFIGQAGIQISESILQTMNAEHNIANDGIVNDLENKNQGKECIYINVFEKKYRPRFLFIDLDPMTIDVLKNGKYKQLLSDSNFVRGKEDCANISVKGYYTSGKEIIDNALDKIRILSEGCKSLEGFIIFHSISGGTGSGFTSLLAERLSVNYGKKLKINFCIFPSKSIRNNVVEPFNSILSVHSLTEHFDVTNVLTNQSLYSYYEKKYHMSNSSYNEINSVISEVFSNFTMNFRQNNSGENMNLSKFSMNMVPYKRVSFLFLSHNKSFYNVNSESLIRFPNLSENIKSMFSLESNLTRSDLNHEKFMSCSLFHKGNNNYFDLLNSIRTQKELGKIQFVDWLPNTFNVSLIDNSNSFARHIDRSTTMFSNSGSFHKICDELSLEFEKLYRKHAFVHWFVGEGMESGEFMECREDFAALRRDYEEVISDSQIFDVDENNSSVLS